MARCIPCRPRGRPAPDPKHNSLTVTAEPRLNAQAAIPNGADGQSTALLDDEEKLEEEGAEDKEASHSSKKEDSLSSLSLWSRRGHSVNLHSYSSASKAYQETKIGGHALDHRLLFRPARSLQNSLSNAAQRYGRDVGKFRDSSRSHRFVYWGARDAKKEYNPTKIGGHAFDHIRFLGRGRPSRPTLVPGAVIKYSKGLGTLKRSPQSLEGLNLVHLPVNLVIERFTCGICRLILHEPRRLLACNHAFCRQCLLTGGFSPVIAGGRGDDARRLEFPLPESQLCPTCGSPIVPQLETGAWMARMPLLEAFMSREFGVSAIRQPSRRSNMLADDGSCVNYLPQRGSEHVDEESARLGRAGRRLLAAIGQLHPQGTDGIVEHQVEEADDRVSDVGEEGEVDSATPSKRSRKWPRTAMLATACLLLPKIVRTFGPVDEDIVDEPQRAGDSLLNDQQTSPASPSSVNAPSSLRKPKTMVTPSQTCGRTNSAVEALPEGLQPLPAVPDQEAAASWRNLVSQLHPSSILRQFSCLRTLGQGNFSTVRLMRRAGKLCTLKESLRIKEAMHEAKLLTTIHSSNVVSLQDFFIEEVAGTPRSYLQQEYCNAGDLERFILRAQRLDENRIASVVIQLARGLQAIHEAHIIHCDLKPSNILLTSEGIVKISDFGVSKELLPSRLGTIHPAGTLAFMAPEVKRFLLGEPVKFDRRADIWSLGAVAYVMATGNVEPNFNNRPVAELVEDVIEALGPGIVAKVVGGMLQAAPDVRMTLSDVHLLLSRNTDGSVTDVSGRRANL